MQKWANAAFDRMNSVHNEHKKFKVKIGFGPKGLMYIIQTLLIRFIASFRLIIPYNTAHLITLIIFERNWKLKWREDIYVQNRSLGSYLCVSNDKIERLKYCQY